jgi:hypothetical protein
MLPSVTDETDELRKRRMQQMAGWPVSAGLGTDMTGVFSRAYGVGPRV